MIGTASISLKHIYYRYKFAAAFLSTMSRYERLPARPFSFFETENISSDTKRFKPTPSVPVDLSSLNKELLKMEEMRTKCTELAVGLKLITIDARQKLSSSAYTSDFDETTFQPLLLQIQQHHGSHGDKMVTNTTNAIAESSNVTEGRDFQLSNRLEEYARFKAFAHFLKTGTLIPPDAFRFPSSTLSSISTSSLLSDEEYLTGAVMGLTEELSRYVIGRAIVRDMSSVVLAKTMVEKILDYLLTFDFRNGYLRRKYDGVKYALKTCEQVLYELSIINTNETNKVDGIHQNETDMDTDQMLSDTSIIPIDSLADLRKRIEHKDNIRESLIKNCRDAQKAAKQAIFAIHRGEHSRALKYIRDCETMIINILLPLTTEDPSLRWGGSLGAVMEEYVEAKLFFVWLHGTFGLEDGTLDSTAIHGDVRKTSTYPCGKIMHPLEFPFTVRPDEYLGALSDVTGEIGRFAVQRGTVRDTVGVTLCLDVCAMIVQSIESLHRYPYGFGKKIDQLKRNVEKLERMLYEMSFIQATGRSLTTKDFASAETEGSTNNY